MFLVLVFVDAIVLALKHSGMSDEFACALRIWQVCVEVEWGRVGRSGIGRGKRGVA